jgi:hypothetical protein
VREGGKRRENANFGTPLIPFNCIESQLIPFNYDVLRITQHRYIGIEKKRCRQYTIVEQVQEMQT